MERFAMKRLLLATAALLACSPAFGQATYGSGVGVWGVNTQTNTACLIGVAPYVSTCVMPIGGATLSLPSFGSTNPTTGIPVGFWNGTAYVQASTASPLPVSGGAVSDFTTGAVNSAAAGVVSTIGPLNGIGFAVLRINSLTATGVTVQGSLDGVTYSTLAIANIGQAPSTAPITAAGTYGIPGASDFRYLQVVQVGSGAAQTILNAGTGSGAKFVFSLLADAFATKSHCAATTAAPTYTTGTTNPLSCDTAGNTRVISANLPALVDTNVGAPTNNTLRFALANNGAISVYGAGGAGHPFTQGLSVCGADCLSVFVGGNIGYGTAGTSNANVSTVQGIAGGVALGASIADGSDVAFGAKADTASCAAGGTALACFRQLHADMIATGVVKPPASTPTGGTASTVTTGGTAVTAVTPTNGCQIINPLTAGDEGIGAVEPLYINIVTTAGTAANGSTAALAPGQGFTCVPGQTTAVSMNAATSGHKATVFAW